MRVLYLRALPRHFRRYLSGYVPMQLLRDLRDNLRVLLTHRTPSYRVPNVPFSDRQEETPSNLIQSRAEAFHDLTSIRTGLNMCAYPLQAA